MTEGNCENMKTTNILIVGVGGQGIVLSSEILAKVALAGGFDVKQNEVHGMAQRGGSVTSHVRFGEVVFSPTIEPGTADVLLAFEQLEALRWLHYLAPNGIALVNLQKIDPITVAAGAVAYPENIEQKLQQGCPQFKSINGLDIAEKAGNLRAVNMVLLGALSRHLEFEKQLWEDCIRQRVPGRTIEMNLAAFHAGIEAVK
jgi:indolepyruvate ferredoxin oxidoreductase beta subunit